MIQEITSKQNSKIKYCLKLHQQSFRKEEGKFLVEGEHLLEMALQNNAVLEVYFTKDTHQSLVKLKRMSKNLSFLEERLKHTIEHSPKVML